MINYMDLVQTTFQSATDWNPDNSYSTLNVSARCSTPDWHLSMHTR